MKRNPQRALLFAVSLSALIVCSAGCSRRTVLAQSGQQSVPGAQADIHVVSPLPNGQWTLPLGDLAAVHFSPLGQINSGNVHNLHLVSSMATGIPHGHEGGPLVVNDTMYVITPFPNKLIAIDLHNPNGPVKWEYNPHPDGRAEGIACCDVVNRGGSYADGKIIYATLDGNVVAVDAKTGKEVWRTPVANMNLGETITMAPLVVKNRVIVGNSGGELGVRGKDVGLNLADGKIVWTAYSSGPDKDVLIGPDFHPFYAKDQGADLGAKTWTSQEWKMGGATQWGWVSYDPELNLIYYGTGNPGVWNADQRQGDNKWSCTIWARDPDTGRAKWAFQISPDDAGTMTKSWKTFSST